MHRASLYYNSKVTRSRAVGFFENADELHLTPYPVSEKIVKTVDKYSQIWDVEELLEQEFDRDFNDRRKEVITMEKCAANKKVWFLPRHQHRLSKL